MTNTPIKFVSGSVTVPEYILSAINSVNVFRHLSCVLITPFPTYAGQGVWIGEFIGSDGVSYTALGHPVNPTIY